MLQYFLSAGDHVDFDDLLALSFMRSVLLQRLRYFIDVRISLLPELGYPVVKSAWSYTMLLKPLMVGKAAVAAFHNKVKAFFGSEIPAVHCTPHIFRVKCCNSSSDVGVKCNKSNYYYEVFWNSRQSALKLGAYLKWIEVDKLKDAVYLDNCIIYEGERIKSVPSSIVSLMLAYKPIQKELEEMNKKEQNNTETREMI